MRDPEERHDYVRPETSARAGCLNTLPEEHRTVLMLREIEEMDYAQIAAVTNVPIGTVMSRLARSRAALKNKWMHEVEGVPRAVR